MHLHCKMQIWKLGFLSDFDTILNCTLFAMNLIFYATKWNTPISRNAWTAVIFNPSESSLRWKGMKKLCSLFIATKLDRPKLSIKDKG